MTRWRNSSVETAYTYNSWCHMRVRCYDQSSDRYPFYGARGIQVCERWRDDYDAFVDDMGLRPAGTTLERIDNAGNYEPGNCRWVTRAEQIRNTRRSKIINFKGRSKNLTDWASEFETTEGNVRGYLKRHSVDVAFGKLIQRMDI